MSDNAEIRNLKMMENYKLYFRTRSRESKNYKELVKRTGREPDVIFPDGWYDADIDRVIRGTSCVHFGMQEFKRTDNLKEPFQWNSAEQRQEIKRLLVKSDYHIEYCTLNFTIPGRIGILSDVNAAYDGKVDYDTYLRTVKRCKLTDNEDGKNEVGKGVFLFVFYTGDCRYFAPINFTGSHYVFGDGGLGVGVNAVKGILNRYGGRIQPCFNEYLLFLVEAYIRQDFDTLYNCLLDADTKDLIRYQYDWEAEISDVLIDHLEDISRWDAVTHVMEEIMECIHFDTIIDNPQKYYEFVDLVRTGELAGYISDIIWYRVNDVERTHQKELVTRG